MDETNSDCKKIKRSDATDLEYAKEIFNKIYSHFDSEDTRIKIDEVIKAFIKEQLLDNNQFKKLLNNAILDSVKQITITENVTLLETILKNSTIFQSYMNVFNPDNTLDEPTKENSLKSAYTEFVNFLKNKMNNTENNSNKQPNNEDDVVVGSTATNQNVESGAGSKAFKCIYEGCDDKKIRDLFIHLAKAATTVKYKGRLAKKLIDHAKKIIKNYDNDIEKIIKNALNSLNFADDVKTMNSILFLMINDNSDTKDKNAKIMKDLLLEIIPKLKENPVLRNNSDCVSIESFTNLEEKNSKLNKENSILKEEISKLKEENSKLNKKFNEIQQGRVIGTVNTDNISPLVEAKNDVVAKKNNNGGQKFKSLKKSNNTYKLFKSGINVHNSRSKKRQSKNQFTKKRHRMIRKKTNRKTKKYGK